MAPMVGRQMEQQTGLQTAQLTLWGPNHGAESSDGAESDGEETDGAENDGAESDGAESGGAESEVQERRARWRRARWQLVQAPRTCKQENDSGEGGGCEGGTDGGESGDGGSAGDGVSGGEGSGGKVVTVARAVAVARAVRATRAARRAAAARVDAVQTRSVRKAAEVRVGGMLQRGHSRAWRMLGCGCTYLSVLAAVLCLASLSGRYRPLSLSWPWRSAVQAVRAMVMVENRSAQQS
jgi:hypothetical protein